MRIWVLAMTLVVWGCSTSSAPRRAAYIRDLSTENVASHQIREVIPYGLGRYLGTPEGQHTLDHWLEEQHARGLRVIAPVAGSSRVAEIRAFGASRFDGFVTELEYWRRPDRAAAFAELLALVRDLRTAAVPGTPIGVYLGYPTRDEAIQLAHAVDFVFVNTNVRDPRRVAERRASLAGSPLAIWAIVYAEGEANRHAALAAQGLAASEHEVAQELAGVNVAGFVYFTARALP